MTSNVGSRALASKTPAVGYATSAAMSHEASCRETDYRNALEQTFAPEFMGRIDDIVIFNTPELDDIVRIVDLELQSLSSRAGALGYTIEVSNAAKNELATLGYDADYGVRSLKRAILSRIEEPLAQMIVSGEVQPGQTIDIGCCGDEIELLVNPVARTA